MSEERLIEVETKLSYHEHLIEELNEVVRTQQGTIDKLETVIERLIKQLDESSAKRIGPGNEKPPHY